MYDHADNLYMAKKFLVKEINVNTNLKKLKKKKKECKNTLKPLAAKKTANVYSYTGLCI